MAQSINPNEHCHLTRPELVAGGYHLNVNCFNCSLKGTLCLVADHPLALPVAQAQAQAQAPAAPAGN